MYSYQTITKQKNLRGDVNMKLTRFENQLIEVIGTNNQPKSLGIVNTSYQAEEIVKRHNGYCKLKKRNRDLSNAFLESLVKNEDMKNENDKAIEALQTWMVTIKKELK